MTLLAAAALLGMLAAGWVVAPLVARRLALLGDAVPAGVIDAQARKRVALAALKEVEYDRIGGKLDDEDYQRVKAQLELEALAALRAVEGLEEQGDGDFTVTHACGFTNPAGSRFCAGCGTQLG